MVDPGSAGGGSCRCACQEDQDQEQDQESGGCCCCSPHVFTSILLGFLSCVLMTGGVFLAFHRWDPMWLMVSGVGVVLILIGTILHCCHHASQRTNSKRRSGKCPRPPPDHPHHHNLMPSGSLTEQLLPLTNARSVSQLSLNMLPGYFPPVVTAYGIEQHSAVVQNINRQLIQQQQSQQSQQSATGSCSPGIVSNGGGKSFIVLSLPSDAATPANIQNLVATVYQLDGSAAETSANEASPQNGAPVAVVKPNPSPVPLILKNAEVQTCSVWPIAPPTIADAPSTSRSTPETEAPSTSQSPSAVTGSTQTEEDDLPPVLPPPQTVDLMDCSPDSVAPICDNAARTCENQDNVHIPPDVPEAVECCTSTAAVLVDIPETTAENLGPPTTLLFDVVVTTPPDVRCSEVLVDITTTNSDPVDATAQGPSSDILVELPEDASDSNLQTLNPEQASGDLSDAEMDESELMGRSSPPPSYEDVTTTEGGESGTFGLAYGTI